MAFTEFCCRSGGSNLNAGALTGGSTEPGTTAAFTYASGNWVAGTGVFTVASGDPASTVIGPVTFQGYTTSYGDLGKAIIDGGTAGASYVLLTLSGNGADRTSLHSIKRRCRICDGARSHRKRERPSPRSASSFLPRSRIR